MTAKPEWYDRVVAKIRATGATEKAKEAAIRSLSGYPRDSEEPPVTTREGVDGTGVYLNVLGTGGDYFDAWGNYTEILPPGA